MRRFREILHTLYGSLSNNVFVRTKEKLSELRGSTNSEPYHQPVALEEVERRLATARRYRAALLSESSDYSFPTGEPQDETEQEVLPARDIGPCTVDGKPVLLEIWGASSGVLSSPNDKGPEKAAVVEPERGFDDGA